MFALNRFGSQRKSNVNFLRESICSISKKQRLSILLPVKYGRLGESRAGKWFVRLILNAKNTFTGRVIGYRFRMIMTDVNVLFVDVFILAH